MRKLGVRQQRTLRTPVSLQGAGLLSGRTVRLTFRPAPPNTGPIFIRTDLATPAYVPARAALVTDTYRRTTLGHLPNGVTLVEHVLSALAGLRIDNCYIDLDGPEPPGLDGSSWRFVEVIREAGSLSQRATRGIWTVREPVRVERGAASITFNPSDHDELRISYALDYGLDSPIDSQRHTQLITPEAYVRDLAPCRTFLLESEAIELHRAGVGLHLTPSDVLVFGPSGRPIDNVLRFPNEPARHKILDILGDVALFGRDLRGHIVASKSGHPLNALLVQELVKLMPVRAGARIHEAGFRIPDAGTRNPLPEPASPRPEKTAELFRFIRN